jgi:hypothetical protein
MTDAWDPLAIFRRLALALLVAVVVAMGFQAGRWSQPPAVPRPLPEPSANPSPAAGGTTVDWPGATRMVQLVPVGYSQTQEGAVAAASNYAQVLRGNVLLDESLSLSTVQTASGTSDSPLAARVEQRARAVGAQLQLTGPVGGNAVTVHFSAVAYHLDSYRPEKAVVSIWGVWLVGRYLVLPATQSWMTLTDTLLWNGGDWKLRDEQEVSGPAPRLSQTMASGTDLPEQLARYQPFRATPGHQG